MSDIVRSLEATVSGSEGVSRRAVLQFAGLIGLSTAVGAAVSACAGPQSAAGSGPGSQKTLPSGSLPSS